MAQLGTRQGISFLVLNLRLWEERQTKGNCMGSEKNSGWWWEAALELKIPQLLNGVIVSKARHGGMCLQSQHLVS